MLQEVPGEKLVYAAATVAVGLSERLGLEELNVLANFLNAVGDNLAVIASQREAASQGDSPAGSARPRGHEAEKPGQTGIGPGRPAR